MEEQTSSSSRVVRLSFSRRKFSVEDIRLKGVEKFSELTFEMVRPRRAWGAPDSVAASA